MSLEAARLTSSYVLVARTLSHDRIVMQESLRNGATLLEEGENGCLRTASSICLVGFCERHSVLAVASGNPVLSFYTMYVAACSPRGP